MVFMCQNDSYLREFTSKVTACEPAESKIEQKDGSYVKAKGYNVELEDTILFPEGGGQPCDYGTVGGLPVKKVARKSARALHFVESCLEIGSLVELQVDWERRFDHMQQHSAQHLITAIADNQFGFQTTSWDLGRNISYIELNTPQVTDSQLAEIERQANQAIQDHKPVVVHVTTVGSPLLNSVRTRGLPADHVGDVRIVEMQGIEANMCCGTHVSNLSHLQCIKLLSAEKGKKGKTNLYFRAGKRVLAYAQKCYLSQKELTKHLKCGPDQHVSAVERSMKQLKLAQRNCTTFLRDIAVLEAKLFKQAVQDGNDRILILHRKEGTAEFMNIIANEVSEACEAFIFLTIGDEKGEGMFLLQGPGKFVEECGSDIMEKICGKGFSKGGRMQGKADKLQKLDQAIAIVQEYARNKLVGSG